MNAKKKQLCKCSLAAIICAGLMSCSYIDSKLDKNQPTQRQQQCNLLKNQMTLGQGSAGIATAASKNPAQDARVMYLYDKNRCAELETGN